MERHLGPAWLIVTVISWLSFGVASWFWVDEIGNSRMLLLTILWFVISLLLFIAGLRYRNSSR